VKPPRLALLLLAASAPEGDRDAMVGDLLEEHAERARRDGRLRAGAWALREAAFSFRHNWTRKRAAAHATPAPAGGDDMSTRIVEELRFALRGLARHPRHAAAVALTLALGIGANSVAYSVVDGLVLNPFPFPQPERLIAIGSVVPRQGGELSFIENLSPAEYLDIAREVPSLEKVVAWDMGNRQLAGQGEPENSFTSFWWGDAFGTLGLAPALGRGFTEEEIRTGAKVAIVSGRSFRNRLGGDPALLGRAVFVNGVAHTLVGVMPDELRLYGTDLWTPMPVGPEVFPRSRRQFQVIGRLRPEATLAQLEAELAALGERTRALHGATVADYDGFRMVPMTWSDANVRQLRPVALALMGAVLCVLVLACTSVASLSLARAADRQREMAVRQALGGRRGDLLGQLFAESVVVALVGGILGTAVAALGVRGFAELLAQVPFAPGSVAINSRVLLFTLGVSVVAGLASGLAPALATVREQLADLLRSDGRVTAVRSRLRFQRLFVGIEVAAAVTLLAGCGLLVRSFERQRVDPGVAAGELLTARITLPTERYRGDEIGRFFERFEERLATQPGVRGATVASQIPTIAIQRANLNVVGETTDPERRPVVFLTFVSPSYFDTLGLTMLAGRGFEATDVPGQTPKIVVNEAAAERYFGGRAVGRSVEVQVGQGVHPTEVVGVVASARNRSLDAPAEPEIFVNTRQVPTGNNQLFVLLRAAGSPTALVSTLRAAARELDPGLPVYAVQSLEQAYASRGLPRRIATTLLSAFAAFALALAAAGIYAIVAHAAATRTREIGVRIALGAGARQVRRLIAPQALVPVALGALAGMLGALALGRGLDRLLYEVSAADPLTLGAVALLLGLVAWVAGDLPARRAARLDPVLALREGD
jgi:predicted permease